MPLWVDDLQMAENWGMKPWKLEDAPALWVERWRLWNNAKAGRSKVPIE